MAPVLLIPLSGAEESTSVKKYAVVDCAAHVIDGFAESNSGDEHCV